MRTTQDIVGQYVLDHRRTLASGSIAILRSLRAQAIRELRLMFTPDELDVACSLFVRATDFSACEFCGEEMRHDDDGPRVCRFCNQGIPNTSNQAVAQ